jgi:hypothetical protein
VSWSAKAVDNNVFVCPGLDAPLPCPLYATHQVPGAATATAKPATLTLANLRDNTNYTIHVQALYHMPLGAPDIVVDAAANLTTKPWQVHKTHVSADWTSAHFVFNDDPGGADPYLIYAARSWEHKPGDYWLAATAPAGKTTEYTLGGLTPNTQYWFQISRGNSRSTDLPPTVGTGPSIKTWVPQYTAPTATLAGDTLTATLSSVWNADGTQQAWVKPKGAPEAIYIGSKPNKASPAGATAGTLKATLELDDQQPATVYQTMDVNGMILKTPNTTVIPSQKATITITTIKYVNTYTQFGAKPVLKGGTYEPCDPTKFACTAVSDHYWVDGNECRDSYYTWLNHGSLAQSALDNSCMRWVRTGEIVGKSGTLQITWKYAKGTGLKKGDKIEVRNKYSNLCTATYPKTSCQTWKSSTSQSSPAASGKPGGVSLALGGAQTWEDINAYSVKTGRSKPWKGSCKSFNCSFTPKVAAKKQDKTDPIKAPTSLKVSGVTITTAQVTWKKGANAQIAIAYHKNGPWIYKGSTTGGKWTLSKLTPNMTYWVKVFHTKGKETSSKAILKDFKTKPSTPKAPTFANITANSFRINWTSAWAGNPGYGKSKTAVYASLSPTGPWSYWATVTAQRYYEAPRLFPATTYYLRLQDMSGPPGGPRYSASATAQTTTTP